MRNFFYSIGIASFLVCMIFTVATSVTNPFYGMSEAAVAQATTQTTTTGSNGSTSSSQNGTISYSINPAKYKVYTTKKSTKYFSKKSKRMIKGSEYGIGYQGSGIKNHITYYPEEREESLTIEFNNATHCISGGSKECYATPNGPTLFF